MAKYDIIVKGLFKDGWVEMTREISDNEGLELDIESLRSQVSKLLIIVENRDDENL